MRKIYLLLFLFVFVSCVKTLEPPESVLKKVVVVKCILQDSDYQKVYVTYASPGENEDPECVSGARVQLRELGKSTKYLARQTEDGLYEIAFRPDYGVRYCLEVMIDGKEPIYAETTMPHNIGMERLETMIQKYGFLNNEERKADYEEFRKFYKSLGIESIDELYYGVPDVFLFFSRNIEYTKHFTDYYVTKEVNEYLWIRHSDGVDLVTDHLLADNSNLTHGVYDVEGTCLTGYPLHRGYLRIFHPYDYYNGHASAREYCTAWKTQVETWSPDMFLCDGVLYNVRKPSPYLKGSFIIGCYFGGQKRYGSLVGYSVSEETDRYWADMEKIKSWDKSTDLLELSFANVVEDVYTNISNGYGIFGAVLPITVIKVESTTSYDTTKYYEKYDKMIDYNEKN